MSDAITVVSRRRFCAGACAALVSACGGSSPTSPSAAASDLPVVSGQFATSRVQVTVAGSALDTVGAAALVESVAGVYLLARTGATTFTAVDATCSHESCTITGIDGTTYVCPCHGSRYNRSGQVLAGPAQASLRQFSTAFADGVVTIAL